MKHSLSVAALLALTVSATPVPAQPPPIPAGIDEFESIAEVTLRLFENPELGIPGIEETLVLSSAGLPDAQISRGPHDQTAAAIDIEILSLELMGESPLGPVTVRAGRSFGLPPSMGQITRVRQDRDGEFAGGESFFDVFVVIEIPGLPPLSNCEDPLSGICNDPVTMALNNMHSLPPKGQPYRTPPRTPTMVPVFAPGGVQVGVIVHARHIPTPGCCFFRAPAGGPGQPACASPVRRQDCQRTRINGVRGMFRRGQRCNPATGMCVAC